MLMFHSTYKKTNSSSTCIRCGAYIEWSKLTKGWRPFNADGTPHFKTCLVNEEYMTKQDKELEKKMIELRKKKYKHDSDTLQIGEDEYL